MIDKKNSKIYPLNKNPRILVVRTDRIGDVILSTPVLKNLKEHLPNCFLAMLVAKNNRELVDGNPYLDEVIILDKEKEHRSWFSNLVFAQQLRKYRFHLALILHPTSRVHLITFLAGIPRRIGYNRKLGFLLTDRLPHTKQLGEKHESEYNLDFLRYLDIPIVQKELLFPIKEEAEKSVNTILKSLGLQDNDFFVIHPCASCPSKIWPAERFSQVADTIINKHHLKAIFVSSATQKQLVEKVRQNMKQSSFSLAGILSLSELGSLFKRSRFILTNDSGPAHIAAAVGASLVVIFSRNQPGLSPLRWGPLGEKKVILHKEVGCPSCLAHECKNDFNCIKAISVQEVIQAIEKIL